MCAGGSSPGLSAVGPTFDGTLQTNRRSRKARGRKGEDPMKVAQYEVLGMIQKEISVPPGTIESLATDFSHAT